MFPGIHSRSHYHLPGKFPGIQQGGFIYGIFQQRSRCTADSEGYGNDNPGAKSQGMKQLMAGGGVALIGITLVPLLSGLFG